MRQAAFTSACSIDRAEPGWQWRVIQTRSRCEKALAEILHSAGIETFLPLVRTVRYYGHRRREVRTPLFPSYVFLYGDAAACHVGTRHIASVVPVPSHERLAAELDQIRRALAHSDELTPCPGLAAGTRVRISSGPMEGLEGTVECVRSGNRIVLGVAALGQAVSLETDGALLDVLD